MKTLLLMMVLAVGVVFGEEPGEWEKLNNEAWEMVSLEFPELVSSKGGIEKFRPMIDDMHGMMVKEGGGFEGDPTYPIKLVRLMMSTKTVSTNYHPTPGPAPTPPPAPEKEKLPEWRIEWNKKNAHAWQIMRKEFPAHFANNVMHERLRFLIYRYDKSAKVNDPELYRDPYKPLYFLRHHEEQKAELARQEEARRNAPPPRWEEYVTNEGFQQQRRQAMMSDAERHAEEQQQQMDEMQDKIDAANKKLRDIENGTYK